MKIIDLADFKKTISKDVVKKAEKMIVRELDEVKPNQYESYVDDGSETYDVTLILTKTGNIQKSHCDCEDGNTTYCVHKVAVIISIVEKRKVGSRAVIVKVNPTLQLLQASDVEKLKDWAWDLLQKNKDLEMAFVHQFSDKPNIYSPIDIVKFTNDATKAISKNKKNIEISELKKLVDLWQSIHEPIVNQYLTDVTNELYFNNIHALLDTIKIYRNKINTHSVKINNYADEIYQKIRNAIQMLLADEAWLKAIKYFLRKTNDNLQTLNDDYFNFLITIIPIDSENRKQILITLLAKTHKESLFKESDFLLERQEKLLGIVMSGELFIDYFDMFKPYGYENTYNLKLIRLLIDNGKVENAEKFCNEQVAKNYYEQYNTPYLVLLKDIYKIKNEENKLNELRIKLLPTTFDFEDYLDISKSFTNELAKKDFRSTILTKAKRASQNGKIDATAFCFKIMNEEKSFLKMISLINSTTSYTFIILYFEQMFLANKDLLLKTLLDRREDSWRSTDGELLESYLKILYELMRLHYKENYIALELRDHCSKTYYNNTNLVRFLKKAIPDEYEETKTL